MYVHETEQYFLKAAKTTIRYRRRYTARSCHLNVHLKSPTAKIIVLQNRLKTPRNYFRTNLHTDKGTIIK